MNSTPEERVHLIEKEGLFTRLAEENNLWQNITGAPETYWWSTMRHPPASVPNRFSLVGVAAVRQSVGSFHSFGSASFRVGTLQQYVARLHRLHENKQVV